MLNDFVIDNSKNLEVKGFEEGSFVYKPTTAGQENSWLNDYMSVDKDGNVVQDFGALNKLKFGNIIKVPYDKEVIKKITGFDKNFDEMKLDEKWALFSKLSPDVFDRILNAINNINNKGDVEKKG